MITQVTVAVPTFHRRDMLRASLTQVVSQAHQVSAEPDAQIRVRVLVIDNDPAGSARLTATEAGVDYVIEPDPGLSAVRNRALDESRESQVLVFLDDDEIPMAGWLSTLLSVWTDTGADAVAGRVTTELPDTADSWTRAAYQRPRRTDRQILKAAATNNLLVDLRTVRRLGVRFTPAFGLIGGEDTMFTTELSRSGGTIRWAQDAHVIESVDSGRLQRRWILMRSFRAGNTSALVASRLRPPGPRRLIGSVGDGVGGLLRAGAGTCLAIFAVARQDKERQARGERIAWRGLGLSAGALGRGYYEYAKRRKDASLTSTFVG